MGIPGLGTGLRTTVRQTLNPCACLTGLISVQPGQLAGKGNSNPAMAQHAELKMPEAVLFALSSADLQLQVEGRLVPVHCKVLEVASPVLRGLLMDCGKPSGPLKVSLRLASLSLLDWSRWIAHWTTGSTGPWPWLEAKVRLGSDQVQPCLRLGVHIPCACRWTGA